MKMVTLTSGTIPKKRNPEVSPLFPMHLLLTTMNLILCLLPFHLAPPLYITILLRNNSPRKEKAICRSHPRNHSSALLDPLPSLIHPRPTLRPLTFLLLSPKHNLRCRPYRNHLLSRHQLLSHRHFLTLRCTRLLGG